MFGGVNTGLHNLFYPDNALIYRRVRLVIYETGMTILGGIVGDWGLTYGWVGYGWVGFVCVYAYVLV